MNGQQNPYLKQPQHDEPFEGDPYADHPAPAVTGRSRTSPGSGQHGPTPTPPEQTRRPLLSMPVLVPLVLSLGVNFFTLYAVWQLHWPPGNVFLIFWIENLVVGVTTLPRIVSARGGGDRDGPPRVLGNIVLAAFYCFHYGLFCLVHLVFTALLASEIGWELTPVMLGLPAALILLRHVIELISTWFLGGLYQRVSPGTAMGSSYGRIAVLHVAVLLGFLAMQGGMFSPDGGVQTRDPLLPVLILVLLKTGADVLTTIRAARG